MKRLNGIINEQASRYAKNTMKRRTLSSHWCVELPATLAPKFPSSFQPRAKLQIQRQSLCMCSKSMRDDDGGGEVL